MAKLELYYPVKPYHLNQGFGLNPQFYAKFNLKGHNGNDLMAYHGQPVYAPCDGMAWYSVDDYKGDGVNIRTIQTYDYTFDDGRIIQVNHRIVLWHLCSANDPQFPIKIRTDGTMIPVKIGQLVGYADNTGAPMESTGDHLHVGMHPEQQSNVPGTEMDYTAVEEGNGYNGCIDPLPYWNGQFAEDVATTEQAVDIAETAVKIAPQIEDKGLENSLLSAILNLLKKVASFLTK